MSAAVFFRAGACFGFLVAAVLASDRDDWR